jgi:hypothetical protein
MAEVFDIDGLRHQRIREQQEKMASALRSLLARVEAGEVIGVTFAAIDTDRQQIWISALHNSSCGFHELVGAASILAENVAAASRS